MTEAYRYIPAQEADIPFIAAVYEANIAALHGAHRSADDWKAQLADAASRYWLILAGTPAGWFRTEAAGDALCLGMLQIAPERQRRGAGRFVLRTVERMARDAGFARVVIHTTQDNAPAAALYASAGYVLTETGPCTTADGAERTGFTFEKRIEN